MKKIKTACCLMLLITILLSVVSPTALAADQESGGRLTIHCEYEETAIPSVPFSLYYVGKISGSTITMSDAFASFPLDGDVLDPDGWNGMALTLKGYALANNLTPSASGQSDENGVMLFEHLTPGLYLVVGETTTFDSKIYTSAPFFVSFPYVDPETGKLTYEQNVRAKFTCEPIIDDKTVTRKVLKIWDDENYESKRPAEITVRLFCDGEEYEAVTLNKDNNWRYTWEKLPDGHDWLAVEDAVPGYAVSVKQEGITFTVKNSYVPDSPRPSTPPSTGGLPHTGLYWWPILILASAGLFCIVLGLLRRKGKNYGKKTR